MVEAAEDQEEETSVEVENPRHFGKVQFGAPQKACTFEDFEDENQGIPLFQEFQTQLAAFLAETLPGQGIDLPAFQRKYVLAHQRVSLETYFRSPIHLFYCHSSRSTDTSRFSMNRR